MKRLLIFLLCLVPFVGGAQSLSRTFIGSPSGMEYNTRIGGYSVTKWMKVPRVLLTLPAYDSAGGGQIAFDSANTRTMWYHNGTQWVQFGSGGGGSGTVTSITAGYGLNGGTITTSGTIRVDTTRIPTRRMLDSVANEIPTDYIDSARLADTAVAIRGAIPSVAGFATTSALADSVSGRQKYPDTATWDATRTWVYANYPPYLGATRDVDVRNFGVLANHINTDTLEPNSSAGLHLHNTSHQDIFIAGAGGGQNLTVYAPTSYVLMANGSETDTVLGTNSSGLLKKIGIGTTYLKKADTASLSARIDAKGSGTVTSIQVVGGTGATVTPTTAVTTSGVYTVTPEVSSATYNTLSNKRWAPRVISSASYTTSVTIPADSVDLFQITAQAGALLFNAPSGTPNNGDLLVIRIKDNGTARALTYNAIFNWSPPSTTVLGKYLVMCFMYNSVTSNWNFMWKRDEP
jgi:hypothetical protein